jgi:hypothetical protein
VDSPGDSGTETPCARTRHTDGTGLAWRIGADRSLRLSRSPRFRRTHGFLWTGPEPQLLRQQRTLRQPLGCRGRQRTDPAPRSGAPEIPADVVAVPVVERPTPRASTEASAPRTLPAARSRAAKDPAMPHVSRAGLSRASAGLAMPHETHPRRGLPRHFVCAAE